MTDEDMKRELGVEMGKPPRGRPEKPQPHPLLDPVPPPPPPPPPPGPPPPGGSDFDPG